MIVARHKLANGSVLEFSKMDEYENWMKANTPQGDPPKEPTVQELKAELDALKVVVTAIKTKVDTLPNPK